MVWISSSHSLGMLGKIDSYMFEYLQNIGDGVLPCRTFGNDLYWFGNICYRSNLHGLYVTRKWGLINM